MERIIFFVDVKKQPQHLRLFCMVKLLKQLGIRILVYHPVSFHHNREECF